MENINNSEIQNNSNPIGKEFVNGEIKYTRICPECKQTLYHTRRGNASEANKKRKICCKCEAKRKSIIFRGENGTFYGKHHTKESIQKCLDTKRKTNFAIWKTPEFLEKMRKISTENNPMKGRSVYSVWLEKYGKEEADRRQVSLNEKRKKIAKRGKDNHQFGKPPPKGTGNGWKGWYKNIFFRSLRELMILIPLIDNNTPYISLENKDYCVQYTDYNGQIRNYFGDFLINNEWIEIKPLKLQSTVENKAKRAAAEEYCKQKGWTFKYIDPFIDSELIKQKYLAGDIKFQERYNEKIKKFYNL